VIKLSVLMSVYNGSSTINHSVDSILNQTYSDFEFIIVNDGSTDETEFLLAKYNDHRLKVINLNHVGLAPALNHGLKYCKGEYIARMDADDWCVDERLMKQVNYLDANKDTDVVSCLVKYNGNSEKNKGYSLHVDWINKLVTNEQMARKRFQDSPLANPSSMFRKSLIDKYGNYSETNLPEDYEFWLRLFHFGVRFGKIEENLFHWSDLPDRITRTNSNYSIDKFFEVKAVYLAKWIKKTFKSTPRIFIIGTGKSVRKRTSLLKHHGFSVYKFVDVKASQNKDTIHITQLPHPDENTLILSYIGDRKGKEKLKRYMMEAGYTEGSNFLYMY